MGYFTEQNETKRRPHENEFWLISDSEMNVRNSYSGINR